MNIEPLKNGQFFPTSLLSLCASSVMILVWILIMTSIGIYTIHTINFCSGKSSVEIIPHGKTDRKVIRILWGADISAYKLHVMEVTTLQLTITGEAVRGSTILFQC